MALVKCKECGEQISTSAKSCPKCGAKPPRKTSLFTWIALFIIILAGYTASQISSTSTSSAGGQSSQSRSSSASSGSGQSGSPLAAAASKPQWEASTSVDQMSGKRKAFASSPTVYPTKKMGFPYSDVMAWLGVGCDGKSEWAYIGFSSSPNLADTETEHGYNRIRTRIKWNETIENVTLIQEWGASFIHFQNDRNAITKISGSDSALLELKWHGQQSTYFDFPMDGSSAALKSMRSKCTK